VEGRPEEAGLPKCLTGKIRAIQRIQSGVLLPNGMKIPGTSDNVASGDTA